jgi:FtsP/CotA-like multicopper oxidase with cupredoxin domain
MADERGWSRRELIRAGSAMLARVAGVAGVAGAAGMSGLAGLATAGCGQRRPSAAASSAAAAPPPPADLTLRIGPVELEVAKGRTVRTTGYNGSAPGPLIRLREGRTVSVEIVNGTAAAELVHWHGQIVPAAVDGAAEEGSLAVPAHGRLRYQLQPGPGGFRFVHTHAAAGGDLTRGSYGGQFAPVYVEPRDEPGRFDQEVFLVTHEWEPQLQGGEMEDEEEEAGEGEGPEAARGKALGAAVAAAEQRPNGWEVGYRLFSINGHALGFGEPLRVREGQRVLLRVLNASATENIRLALPAHRFQILALDGNPVPRPQTVDVLRLGTAERIDALVEMSQPGVWVLGTPRDDDRNAGMGIVVEYAGRGGAPQWRPAPKTRWDYTAFGGARPAPRPDQVIPLVFGKINGGKGGFNRWTVNGKPYGEQGPPQTLRLGARCRLALDNHTDDAHPIHLHRNLFELVSVGGRTTSGVMKDVVLVPPFGRVEVDFTPKQPGLTLFHCHQQLHMDYGFMKLFDVV